MNHPFLEPFKDASEYEGVEDDQAPERNPVNRPEASEPAVQVRFQRVANRRVPYQDAEKDGDEPSDDRREPGGQAQGSQHVEQGDERDHGNKYRQP